MDKTTLVIIIVAVVILVAAGIIFMQRRRTEKLRTHFGPEYERALKETGDKSKAEAELQKREKRVEKLSIHPLEPALRERFITEWERVQAAFVDDPDKAIRDADILLQDVMKARGYPVENFEQVASDISVDHPAVVQHFRTAHDIARRHARGEGSTEDLRKAMINYRALFEELVEDGGAPGDDKSRAADRQLHVAEDHR